MFIPQTARGKCSLTGSVRGWGREQRPREPTMSSETGSGTLEQQRNSSHLLRKVKHLHAKNKMEQEHGHPGRSPESSELLGHHFPPTPMRILSLLDTKSLIPDLWTQSIFWLSPRTQHSSLLPSNSSCVWKLGSNPVRGWALKYPVCCAYDSVYNTTP